MPIRVGLIDANDGLQRDPPGCETGAVTLLRVADLGLSFGSRTVFDGLTLVVEEGERVGLVGPNGSGKSTLLRMLAGEALPDRGERQLRRGVRIGLLEQEPAFPPGATVASELARWVR